MLSLAFPVKPKPRVFNVHFWILAGLILVLAVFYYLDLYFFEQTRHWEFLRTLAIFEFRFDITGLLFVIPFLYAVVVYWWKGALATWLVSLAIIFPRMLYFAPDIASLITNIFYLVVPLLIVVFISTEIKWRERERRALAERENERRVFVSRILKTQENERQRISRELHDGPTQMLLVMAAQAEKLKANYDHDHNRAESQKQIRWIKNMSLLISEELRRLSLDLHPSVLDNLGLVPAVRWMVNQMKSGGINACFLVNGEERKLSSEIEINVFRIVQEGLNNIRRHSQATSAGVELQFESESITLTIDDNGTGFIYPDKDSLTEASKLGLLGIQQRVQTLNGSLVIKSRPGEGTRIKVTLKT